MRTVDGVLGNVRDDADLAAALERHEGAGTLERVEIDAADRVKSRLRVRTDAGTDLGIVTDRPALRDGDVLVADEDCMIVVGFASREALAVDLPGSAAASTLLELGHRIGNQHWDLAVRDGTAYVPLDADLRIVEDVLADALPAAASTSVETVDGSLFVEDEAGGAAGGHHERGGDDHAHDHSHGHGGRQGGGHGHHDHVHGHADADAEHDHVHRDDDSTDRDEQPTENDEHHATRDEHHTAHDEHAVPDRGEQE